MIRIAHAQLWVHDQDEALAFYTEKLGMEVRADVTVAELGNFRWLTVSPAGQDGRLDRPDGDPRRRRCSTPRRPSRSQDLMAKGCAGTVFLTTEDVRASYEELKARGVEFVDEPEERPYGIDSSFRDPSGNHFRLTQLDRGPRAPPSRARPRAAAPAAAPHAGGADRGGALPCTPLRARTRIAAHRSSRCCRCALPAPAAAAAPTAASLSAEIRALRDTTAAQWAGMMSPTATS